jgi:hypothetical protein
LNPIVEKYETFAETRSNYSKIRNCHKKHQHNNSEGSQNEAQGLGSLAS